MINMRRHLTYLALLFWSFAVVPGFSSASEMEERTQIQNDVARAVMRLNFEKLEAMSAKYQSPGERTSSGLWKLTLFYSGIKSAFNTQVREDDFWVSNQRTVEAWVARYPRSPTARLAYAQMLLNHGWSYRGDGYANTVEPQNWKPFREYTQQARSHLEKNKDIGSQDPFWYEMMIIIAYRQSWPEAEFSKLLDEALSRFPSFYQIYFSAIDYLAPKWGGSAEAIEKFARSAQKRTHATEGYGMYARIYWYASQSQYGDSLFAESQVDWPLMRKGIDDVLERYPDAWNINYFARFSCYAGDQAKTAELMRRINPAPVRQAWSSLSSYQECRKWSGVDSGIRPQSAPVGY